MEETIIHTESISVEPGASQQVSVQVENVRMIRPEPIRDPTTNSKNGPTKTIDLIDFNSSIVTPRPGVVMESYPPYWRWDQLQSKVKITLPVRIPVDMPPDTYCCTMRGWQSTDYTIACAGSEDIVITVRNGDI
jgi:hypothetical protein